MCRASSEQAIAPPSSTIGVPEDVYSSAAHGDACCAVMCRGAISSSTMLVRLTFSRNAHQPSCRLVLFCYPRPGLTDEAVASSCSIASLASSSSMTHTRTMGGLSTSVLYPRRHTHTHTHSNLPSVRAREPHWPVSVNGTWPGSRGQLPSQYSGQAEGGEAGEGRLSKSQSGCRAGRKGDGMTGGALTAVQPEFGLNLAMPGQHGRSARSCRCRPLVASFHRLLDRGDSVHLRVSVDVRLDSANQFHECTYLWVHRLRE